LDELGFIHMNGRIFDPIRARFAQADPFIPEVTKLQAFNRYSYVYNNPLRYTDPTGYRPFWEQTANKQAIRAVGSIAAATVIAIYAPQLLAELAPEVFTVAGTTVDANGVVVATRTVGGTANAVATGVIAGSAAGYISSGGDGATALKQGIVGGLFGFVGGTGASNGWSAAGAEGQIKYISSHALVGCVSGAMDGSGCGRGAASAAFGKLVTLNTQGNLGVQVAGTMLAGGVAAKIGGGKFATGAALAGFGYLYNQCSTNPRDCWGEAQAGFSKAIKGVFVDPFVNFANWVQNNPVDAGLTLATVIPTPAAPVAATVRTGMLVERTFVAGGKSIDFIAEAVVAGDRLILNNAALYARGEQALTGMTKDIYRGLAELGEWAGSMGFKTLEVNGVRAANSTSAKPGSVWSWVRETGKQ
jgi:RHS repeat-associated protein